MAVDPGYLRAQTLREAAARLERQIERLAVLERVSAAANPAVWQGAAADRFDDQLGNHRRRLHMLSEEVTMLARLFLQRAEMLEAELQAAGLGGPALPGPGAWPSTPSL